MTRWVERSRGHDVIHGWEARVEMSRQTGTWEELRLVPQQVQRTVRGASPRCVASCVGVGSKWYSSVGSRCLCSLVARITPLRAGVGWCRPQECSAVERDNHETEAEVEAGGRAKDEQGIRRNRGAGARAAQKTSLTAARSEVEDRAPGEHPSCRQSQYCRACGRGRGNANRSSRCIGILRKAGIPEAQRNRQGANPCRAPL